MPINFPFKKLSYISNPLPSNAEGTLSLLWAPVYEDCFGSDICAY